MPPPRLVALLLALATLLVFLPAGRYPFVNLDDPDYITDNPEVSNGLSWKGLKWDCTALHSGNWHPLTWFSHQLDCELFGMNAGAQHDVNLLIHAANAALVFLLAMRLTGRRGFSCVVAGLFAWHPLRVESVAWISERKDVLSGFWGLLALLQYVQYARSRKKRDLAGVVCFYGLALLSKPMVVTLPLVFLLLDFWPLRRVVRVSGPGTKDCTQAGVGRQWLRLAGEKWIFFALALADALVTFAAQKSGGGVVSLASEPLAERLGNLPVLVARYAGKLFWPADLSCLYPLEQAEPAAMAGAALLILVLCGLAWSQRLTRPCVTFGWAWFLIMLLPVLGVVQAGAQSIADRYTYLPCIGFFMSVTWMTSEVMTRLAVPRFWQAACAVVVLLATVAATERQLPVWRSSESLFGRAVTLDPSNLFALVNLGITLQQQDRNAEALAIYRQAEQHETGSYGLLHAHAGEVLNQLGQYAQSQAEFELALQTTPDSAEARVGLAKVDENLGQPEAAISNFSAAEQLNPHDGWPHMDAAELYLKQGQDSTAAVEIQKALALAPDDFKMAALAAHILAANENPACRNGSQALILANRANDLSAHSQPEVYDILGMAYAELGDFNHAAEAARKAVELSQMLGLTHTEDLKERLELYENHRAWHESFQSNSASHFP